MLRGMIVPVYSWIFAAVPFVVLSVRAAGRYMFARMEDIARAEVARHVRDVAAPAPRCDAETAARCLASRTGHVVTVNTNDPEQAARFIARLEALREEQAGGAS